MGQNLQGGYHESFWYLALEEIYHFVVLYVIYYASMLSRTVVEQALPF